jgi:hypothetical protein
MMILLCNDSVAIRYVFQNGAEKYYDDFKTHPNGDQFGSNGGFVCWRKVRLWRVVAWTATAADGKRPGFTGSIHC